MTQEVGGSLTCSSFCGVGLASGVGASSAATTALASGLTCRKDLSSKYHFPALMQRSTTASGASPVGSKGW